MKTVVEGKVVKTVRLDQATIETLLRIHFTALGDTVEFEWDIAYDGWLRGLSVVGTTTTSEESDHYVSRIDRED